jgi:hypothetical protein
VTDLLLALDPLASEERRDRGLLSFHLGDASAALRDLEQYLEDRRRFAPPNQTREPIEPLEPSEPIEPDPIWEHVKTLRRRVASFN